MTSTYVIAEAGVNHNGDASKAFELVDAAAKAGADAIKFQTFKAKNLVTEEADMAEYQVTNVGRSESQLAMLSKLELPFEAFTQLAAHARSRSLDFITTAFDDESLQFVHSELAVPALKIASGELLNAPLLLKHARTELPLIVSTGMATMGDIEQALSLIAFGWTQNKLETPNSQRLRQALASDSGQALLREKVTLLHCTTEYPTPLHDVNLRAIDSMRAAFDIPVGYSDHTQGIAVAIAAVARGASMIEKHFTLDRQLPGPDHAASLEPAALTEMIAGIRSVEQALGSGFKGPCQSELKIMTAARKSLVAARSIAAGEVFDEENLATMRPGNGRSPMDYWQLLGTKSRRSYKPGELILD